MAKNLVKEQLKKYLIKKKITKVKNRFNGLTFKENCNDIRNSQSFKIIDFFNKKKKLKLSIHL